MKLKEGYTVSLDTSVTEGIFDGYVKPSEALVNQTEIDWVENAIKVVEQFASLVESVVEEY